MRNPTLFFRLLCGAALTTLSLSTLPVSAQTRHHPPVEMDDFLMPATWAPKSDGDANGDDNDPDFRAHQKYWRLIHGDRKGRINSANLARAQRQAARMQPMTWAQLHSGGTNGPGDGQYGFGSGHGGGVGGGGGGGGRGGGRGLSAGPPNRTGGAPGFKALGGGVVVPGGGSLVGPGLPVPTAASAWNIAGPNQILNPGFDSVFGGTIYFIGPDPTAGRVNGAAFDPTNPNVMYVAAPGGGIWKTVNGGATWLPLTDYVPGVIAGAFSSVTVDPNNNNVIYAGSGDYDGGDGLGFGLLKSIDGGATWTTTSLASGQYCIHKVLIDPSNSNHVLVTAGRDGTGTGVIFQSTDAGATWQDVADFPSAPGPNSLPAGDVSDIVYNSNGTVLYASVDEAGIFASNDNGNTWSGPLGGLAATDRVDVAASPNQPNTLYYLSNGDEAIYKSIDGGNTWNDITANFVNSYGFPPGPNYPNPYNPWSQGGYDFHIEAAPATFTIGGPGVENGPGTVTYDVLYVGLLSISSCVIDPTNTSPGFWSDITYSYTGNATIHTDQHCLIFNPNNPNQMLVGSDGGIYLAAFSPDDNTFDVQGLNNNLEIAQCYGSSVNPNNINEILLGVQDNFVPHADGDLNVWNVLTSGDGMAVQYTSTAPLVQYSAEYNGIVFQSDNDWGNDPFNQSTFEVDVPDLFVGFYTPLAMAANSRILVSAGENLDVFDHGATVYPAKTGKWTAGATLPLGFPGDFATAVGASPTNEDILYAGMASGLVGFTLTQGKEKAAWEIDGNNWLIKVNGTLMMEPIVPANPFSLPALPVTAFAGGYKNVNRLYVTMGQNTNQGISHIYRCDNISGVTLTNPQVPIWWDLSGNGGPSPLPEVSINAIVVLPHDDENSIIVATDIGVFMTTNASVAPNQPVIWSPISTIPSTTTSLPSSVVTNLNYNPGTGTLDADLYGRGLWRAVIGVDTPFLIATEMPGYRGNKSNLTARVDLFQSNLPVVAPNFEEPGAVGYPYKVTPKGKAVGTPNPYKYLLQPSEVQTATLSPTGYFTTNVSVKGYFDALITVPRFLRRKIVGINTVISPLNVANLILGDCAGAPDASTGLPGPPDNVIDGNDLNAIATYILYEELGLVSKYNNGPLDLNGDGVVDIKDYNLVVAAMLANGGRPVQGD